MGGERGQGRPPPAPISQKGAFSPLILPPRDSGCPQGSWLSVFPPQIPFFVETLVNVILPKTLPQGSPPLGLPPFLSLVPREI